MGQLLLGLRKCPAQVPQREPRMAPGECCPRGARTETPLPSWWNCTLMFDFPYAMKINPSHDMYSGNHLRRAHCSARCAAAFSRAKPWALLNAGSLWISSLAFPLLAICDSSFCMPKDGAVRVCRPSAPMRIRSWDCPHPHPCTFVTDAPHVVEQETVVGLFDVMEKVITLVDFQIACVDVLMTLWMSNAQNVRQEIVDEGGMNLVLSLFSNAVQSADVLLACFPLLQEMIAHAIADPSPESPLSEAEVQVVVALMSYHPTNIAVLSASLQALLLLTRDSSNKFDVVRQKGAEVMGTMLSGAPMQENFDVLAPLVLELLEAFFADPALLDMALTHGLVPCVERFLAASLAAHSGEHVKAALQLLQTASGLASIGTALPSLADCLVDRSMQSALGMPCPGSYPAPRPLASAPAPATG